MEAVEVSSVSAIATGAEARAKMTLRASLVGSNANKAAEEQALLEQPLSFANFYRRINWLNTALIAIIPLIGFVASFFVPLSGPTALWMFIYYYFTGLGITAGYHRMWAHRSYKATLPLRMFLMCVGSGAAEGSIKWWSNGHRTHHRYTDTEKDPYNAKRGFWYSHMGWMLFKQNPKLKGRTDISDLNADPVVRFQHKYYVHLLVFFTYVFPMLVAGFGWNDFVGGLVYAGVLRAFIVHQSTFCVNSLAHWLGEQPFDDRRSPRDHAITAFASFGEGYHNFHHEFPSDYRNALKWWQYDPTKHFIWAMSKVGFAYDLQKFSSNAIQQGQLQMKQKRLDTWRAQLDWGIPIDQLPVIEFDDFKDQSTERHLVVISGIVHDVTDFVERHPGGRALIMSGVGKDATAVFNGGVYLHSNAAHNMLARMRVAVIRGGSEVEIWKRAQSEKKNVNPVVDSTGEQITRSGQQPTTTAALAETGRAA